jgi:glycosyltransferase involved in cell wall biosynthesis
MNIMHIIDSGGFYGAEVMLLELMVGQKKLGLQPLLCSMGTINQGEKEIERQAGLHGIEVTTIRTRAGLNPYTIYRILLTARARHADIIHSHGYKGNILAGCIPGFVRKAPLVSTLHGWTNTVPGSRLALYEWLDRKMLHYKDAVITVNRLMLNDIRLTSARIDSQKLFVVKNGIAAEPPEATDPGSPEQIRIRQFTRTGFIIGAIGRLSAEKGFEYLLDATAQLYHSGHGIRLVLAGEGPQRQQLEQHAVKLGIDDIVLFTGYLANASRFLPGFDVLAISSLSEGLPITLLEAMRAGIPVVSTSVGGIPDVIRQEKSGILVPPADATALAMGIKQIIDNPDLKGALARQARITFLEDLTSDRMASDYQAIYRKLVADRTHR